MLLYKPQITPEAFYLAFGHFFYFIASLRHVSLKGRLFLMKTREYSLTHEGISLVGLNLIEDK